MAMIECPECNKQVSNQAPACPNCGCPISGKAEAAAAGTPLTTTQSTSKRFKLQSLISACMVIIGAIWIFSAGSDPSGSSDPTIPGAMVLIGIVWFIVNRFRIWWHHK